MVLMLTERRTKQERISDKIYKRYMIFDRKFSYGILSHIKRNACALDKNCITIFPQTIIDHCRFTSNNMNHKARSQKRIDGMDTYSDIRDYMDRIYSINSAGRRRYRNTISYEIYHHLREAGLL